MTKMGSGKESSLAKSISVLIFCCLTILLSGCATVRPAQGGRFQFALLGDVPYDARQEKEFANVMKVINAADSAFVLDCLRREGIGRVRPVRRKIRVSLRASRASDWTWGSKGPIAHGNSGLVTAILLDSFHWPSVPRDRRHDD